MPKRHHQPFTRTTNAPLITVLALCSVISLFSPVDFCSVAGAAEAPDLIVVQLDDWSLVSSRRFLNGENSNHSLGNAVIKHGLHYADFQSCYVSQPVCTPSRAALLRGQWPRRTGIVFNTSRPPEAHNGGLEGFVGRGLHLNHIGNWLNLAGYRTAHVGKFMNHLDDGQPLPPLTEDELGVQPLPGWDEWFNLQRAGFGGYHSFVLSENGTVVRYSDNDYSTDVYRDVSLGIIDRTPEDAPLFLHVCPSAPHAPAVPAARHRELYSRTRVPRPPANAAYLEQDVSDKPLYIRSRTVTDPGIIDTQDSLYRTTAQSLTSVGEMIVSLIEHLADTGRLENAVFIITSDNGWSYLEHRVFGKGDVYEPSSRVPLLVLSKNRDIIPRTSSPRQIVSHIDITATLLDLADAVALPNFTLDSVSFAPLLRDPQGPPTRLEVLLESGNGRPAPADLPRRRPDWSSVVTGIDHPRYPSVKYVEYVGGERELYLLQSDPHELENVAGNPDYAEVRQAMAQRLSELKATEN